MGKGNKATKADEREQWFAVGTDVWVLCTRAERRARGWYARRQDGTRSQITRLSDGRAVLETVAAGGWIGERQTFPSLAAAKRAMA